MNILNANDLKVGGVTAIEAALREEPEVAISVRGERRFVVMNMDQYQHLRECELEAAWLATQADRVAGRAKTMTAAQHFADMERRLRTSAATLTARQERAESRQTREATKPVAVQKTRVKPKSARTKVSQTKAR